MPFTIPAEVYIEFEELFGKEKAQRIVKAFENMIDSEIVNKWAQTKFELRDELLKDLVTKVEFETKIESLRVEFRKEIESRFNQMRFELREELLKDLVTKAEFEARIGALRDEFIARNESLRAELTEKIESVRNELTTKIESVRVELRKEIESAIIKLEKRFTIMFLILLFAIIFLNRDALEFILKLLKLI